MNHFYQDYCFDKVVKLLGYRSNHHVINVADAVFYVIYVNTIPSLQHMYECANNDDNGISQVVLDQPQVRYTACRQQITFQIQTHRCWY